MDFSSNLSRVEGIPRGNSLKPILSALLYRHVGCKLKNSTPAGVMMHALIQHSSSEVQAITGVSGAAWRVSM
ncbi:hypothetical protein J6590_104714 [Homalodisca vitripennis]|nr:hypothetical protein J6590_104714 [Homalodisca vitripennis]